MLLRESKLLNGILTNVEIWYNLTKAEIEEFESLDRLFLRRLLEVPASTPCESYYLELGVLPISAVIKARRINYLHTILKSDKHGMLYSFFITQWLNPSKGDWTEQIQEDLEDFKIPCSFDLIEKKSKEAFKKMVKTRAKEYALELLLKKQESHSKMENLSYTDIKIQDYFNSDQMNNEQKRMLFRFRTRMERFGENFRAGNDHVMCPLCFSHYDSQELSLECQEIKKEMTVVGTLKEIYTENIGSDIVNTLTKLTKIRKQKLEI